MNKFNILKKINLKDLNINWKEIVSRTHNLSNSLKRYRFNEHREKNFLIEAIVDFLRDFDYQISFHDVKNILSNVPKTNHELLIYKIHNLFEKHHDLPELLNMYEKIWKEMNSLQNSTIFLFSQSLKNFINEIVVSESFVLDINTNNKDFDIVFLPFVNAQIMNLITSDHLNVKQSNLQFTKIISMWYLTQSQTALPFFYHQKALNLVANKYNRLFFEAIKTANYTKLIAFVFDALNKFIIFDQKTNFIVQKLFQRKNIFMPKHQMHFLFTILYHDLNHFDWKQFQKHANLAATKQYIMRNLNFLANYRLLKTLLIKKRKFYFQSRNLKNLIREYKNYE